MRSEIAKPETANGQDAEKLFCVGDVGVIPFAIFWGFKLQLLTICQQLSCPILFEPLIQFGPVIAGATLSCLIRQHADNIDNGEVPFFFLIAPCSTNRLILKELKVFSAAHADTPPEQVYVV